jgi:hypothetical protein
MLLLSESALVGQWIQSGSSLEFRFEWLVLGGLSSALGLCIVGILVAGLCLLLLWRLKDRPVMRALSVGAVLLASIGAAVGIWAIDLDRAEGGPMRRLLASVPLPATDSSAGSAPRAALDPTSLSPLTPDSIFALRGLLFRSQFDSLEAALRAIEQGSRDALSGEERWDETVGYLSKSSVSVDAQLTAWVVARPTSAIAHLVRAVALVNEGWDRRGGAFASQTSPAQFYGMYSAFSRARGEIVATLRADPRARVGYFLLLQIASAEGDSAGEQLVLRQALRVAPNSVETPLQVLVGQRPQWGGSLARMAAFADSVVREHPDAPDFAVLRGFAPWAEAEQARLAGDYAAAVAAAQRALTVRDHWRFFQELGVDEERLGHFEAARAAYAAAQTEHPLYAKLHEWESQMLYNLATQAPSRDSSIVLLNASMRKAQLALKLNGADSSVRWWFDTLARMRRGR